jgi:Tfp pilus assembly protein PilO
MKLEMKSSSALILAILGVALLAVAFWMLLLSPKRDEAAKLGAEVTALESSLAQHRQEADSAEEARAEFPRNYQQLVVLGKAVPGDDDTASLLVQVNRIADRAGVRFTNLQLAAPAGGEETAAPATPAVGSSVTPVSATEVAASLLPLGATVGPAGLAVMPYTLTFDGDFFEIADFIKGIDSLVKSTNGRVAVNGRLITFDGFSLSASTSAGFPALEATFSVTTYLTPPSQGVTAGATPEAPAAEVATPVATTTGGTP